MVNFNQGKHISVLNFESPLNVTEFEREDSLVTLNDLLGLKAERLSYYLCVEEGG